jgi:hypothetical protein
MVFRKMDVHMPTPARTHSIEYDAKRILALWDLEPNNTAHTIELHFFLGDNRLEWVLIIAQESPGGGWRLRNATRQKISGLKYLSLHDCSGNKLGVLHLFLLAVADQMRNVRNCRHCQLIFWDEVKDGMCAKCRSCEMGRIVSSQCVVCYSNDHPIVFVCPTCLESHICANCFPSECYRTKGIVRCVICKHEPHPAHAQKRFYVRDGPIEDEDDFPLQLLTSDDSTDENGSVDLADSQELDALHPEAESAVVSELTAA